LYVGNLPYNTTEDDLRGLFEPWGPAGDVRIIEGRGFAFVDVPLEKAEAAIAGTNEKDYGGRTLTVNEARPRTERRDGGGGARRSGGGGGGGRRRESWSGGSRW